jgi:hypothetical protein
VRLGKRDVCETASASGKADGLLSSLELDGDERLTVKHPRVVSWVDAVGITGNKVRLGSIIGSDVEFARDDVAKVSGLAAFRRRTTA